MKKIVNVIVISILLVLMSCSSTSELISTTTPEHVSQEENGTSTNFEDSSQASNSTILSAGRINFSVNSNSTLTTPSPSSLLKAVVSSTISVDIEPTSWVELDTTSLDGTPFLTDDYWTNFGGTLTFTLYSNETVDYDKITLEISMNNGGLVGEGNGNIMPIRLVNENDQSIELTDQLYPFYEDTDSTIVDDAIQLEVEVNTTNLPAQSYSGTLNFTLVGYTSESTPTENPEEEEEEEEQVTTEPYDTTELHGYSSYGTLDDGTVANYTLTVDRKEVNTILALYTVNSIEWTISETEGSHISEVHVYSYSGDPVTIIGLEDVPVYITQTDIYTYQDEEDEAFEDYIKLVFDDTGYTFSSWSSTYYYADVYQQNAFEIDEIALRDEYIIFDPELDDTSFLPDLSFSIVVDGEQTSFTHNGPTDEETATHPSDVDEYIFAFAPTSNTYMHLEKYSDGSSPREIYLTTITEEGSTTDVIPNPGNYEIIDIGYNSQTETFFALVYSEGYIYEYDIESNSWTLTSSFDTGYESKKIVYNPIDNCIYSIDYDYYNHNYQEIVVILKKINLSDSGEVSSTTISTQISKGYLDSNSSDFVVDENGELIVLVDGNFLYHIDFDASEATLFYKLND